jgi:MFS family permease
MSSIPANARAADSPMTAEERKVIFASSLGTVFEWYDFYLYGSLAAIIAKQFFSGLDPSAAFIFALLAFAAGFIVRPFGALVFGRLGDMIGRKYTFLVTIMIMGLATFIVGVLPNYASIGVAAPVILITLRMLQGLALGGEYGGAATYVAEHAPQGRRGAYTAWIQTTATLGLFLSLMVILGTRSAIGEEAFADWGWRVPFIVSIFLLAISVWIRLSMNESPAFKKMKEEGKTSKAPLSESFGQWKNLKIVLLALFGLVAGHRHAVLRGLRHAVGQDRPQADHHGRPAARHADLLPAVQVADRSRQPGPGQGASLRPDLRQGRSGHLLVPGQPGGA